MQEWDKDVFPTNLKLVMFAFRILISLMSEYIPWFYRLEFFIKTRYLRLIQHNKLLENLSLLAYSIEPLLEGITVLTIKRKVGSFLGIIYIRLCSKLAKLFKIGGSSPSPSCWVGGFESRNQLESFKIVTVNYSTFLSELHWQWVNWVLK